MDSSHLNVESSFKSVEKLCSLNEFFQFYKSQNSIGDNFPYSVIESIASAGIVIAEKISHAALEGTIGSSSTHVNPSGEVQKKLDVISNDIIIQYLSNSSVPSASLSTEVAYLASEEEEHLVVVNPLEGKYIVAFDPLDGSSNLDCAIATGTIFGIYAYQPSLSSSASNNSVISETDALIFQAGNTLIAAGYIMYSSSTELVLTLGDNSVHGFTLDRRMNSSGKKQFRLTRPNIRVPNRGYYYSLNEGRSADWPKGLYTYIDNIKNGRGEAKGKKYSSRYVCSLVADVHRTLLYGGWAGNPRQHLRLLFEAAPLAFVMENAGGGGSDGKRRICDIIPTSIHCRLPVFLGSIDDIKEIESYDNVQQLSDVKYTH